MLEVGAYHARTHFSALIDKVSGGEEVVITKRGKAIARLVPATPAARPQIRSAIDELLAIREELSLPGVDLKALRDEGRR